MKIATWNVNSLRVRHDAVLEFLSRKEPDVLCLQETKVEDDDFPTDEILRLGYAVAMMGQKTYNGVAIVSRLPMTDIAMGLAGDPNPKDARSVRATIEGVRVHCVYVPNGKSPSSPSFPVKLAWLGHLRATLEQEGPASTPTVVCGDFNVAPDERDVFDPVGMSGHLLFHPDERRALAHVMEYGLTDLFRIHHDAGGHYTWWDYRAGSFRKNEGFRIDLIFGTPSIAKRCTSVEIDQEARRGDRPSDHVPVMATFD